MMMMMMVMMMKYCEKGGRPHLENAPPIRHFRFLDRPWFKKRPGVQDQYVPILELVCRLCP